MRGALDCAPAITEMASNTARFLRMISVPPTRFYHH